MHNNNWLVVGAVFACLWLAVLEVRADQIHLKNGSILTGKVIAQQGDYSIVKFPSGRMTIATNKIARIEEGPSAEELLESIKPLPAEEPADVTKPGEKKPVKPGEEPSKPSSPPQAPKIDPEVKAKADELLGKMGDEKLEWPKREKAADELVKLGKDAVPYLCSLVKNMPWEQGVMVVGVLRQIGDKGAVPTLMELLKKGHPEVGGMAAMVLGYFKEESAVPTLVKLLSEGDEVVRKKAVVAIANFNRPEVVDALVKALDDESWWVRSKAEQALARLRSEGGAIDPIDNLLKLLVGGNPSQRVAICRSLANFKDERALEPLLKLLDDDEESVQIAAANALAHFQKQEVVDSLLEKYYWADLGLRAAIVRSFGKLGDPVAIPILMEALLDTDEAIVNAAAGALSLLTRRNFGTDYERWSSWWQKEAPASLRARAERAYF